MDMETISSFIRDLPEPCVSEEGTFCDSFNDTISRLEGENHETTSRRNSEDSRPSTPISETQRFQTTAELKSERLSKQLEETIADANLRKKHVRSILPDMIDQNSVTKESLVAEIDTSADKFGYNNHNESIFDDFRYFPSLKPDQEVVVKFDDKDPELINHATLKALIVQLTSPEVIDYGLICDFFLTFRTFTNANTVLNLLLTRLIWALQYINSCNPETEKLGKLVLLRTFVVIRHWILNYFYDDFELDEKLCDLFSFHINQIIDELGLIRPEMSFEVKIFSDLKTHWLSQVHEFFSRSSGTESQESVFLAPLPMSPEYFEVKKLTKSNTEASIHTNPSFRRSAMLSLYDQKIHHKCIVHDGQTNTESLPLPISILVNHHKSARVSLDDKIEEYCIKGSSRNNIKFASRREPSAPKHNHMNLKDSSLALKKTSTRAQDSGVETKDDTLKPGFSTNGRIKLPSARVNTIVPLSPVKKMKCSVKEDQKPLAPPEIDDFGRKKSIKKIVEGWTKSLYLPELRSEKPTFSQPHEEDEQQEDSEGTEGTEGDKPHEIGDRVDILSARIIDELEFVIRYYLLDPHQTITETEGNDDTSKAHDIPSPIKKVTDIALASALAETNKRESAATSTKDISLHDISELNIEKIDNLFSQTSINMNTDDIGMSFNSQNRQSHSFAGRRVSRGSRRSSFGGRVASINWNDEGNLMLENSALLCDNSHPAENNSSDVNAELNTEASTEANTEANGIGTRADTSGKSQNHSETPSSDLGYSDVEVYDAEVSDLGIAMSPQSLKRKPVQRIMPNEAFAPGSLGRGLSSFSRRSSDFAHESMKSYLTYDSAFSAISESSRNERYSMHLKKKHGYHDLRKLADSDQLHHLMFSKLSASSNVSAGFTRVNRASMASHATRASTSCKKSTRLSTLCALTELPFSLVHGSFASMSTRALLQDDSGKLSDVSVSSVFSSSAAKDPSSERRSSEMMSSTSVAIPGISHNILRELASIPDESFSSKNPVQHALCKLEGKPGSQSKESKESSLEPSESVGTGMNKGSYVENHALIEAEEVHKNIDRDGTPESMVDVSICDSQRESLRPCDANRTATTVANSPPQTPKLKKLPGFVEHSDNFHNTQDILDEINNAATEDVIGYSSDIEHELKQQPITPIKAQNKSASMLLKSHSTSNVNGFHSSLANSERSSILNPKLVLDGYFLASEYLSVKQVVAAGSHVSFILSYGSKTLAEHFTIIERDILLEIDWKELIELKWNKDLTPVNSWLEIIVNDEYYNKNKGVNLVIARFNLVVNWIISEILLTKSEDERREIVSRLIHVAYHSYEMQNFSTLMQVTLALTSEKVTKLKPTWHKLSPGDILTLKHLEKVTSPMKNFINMRVSTNQIKPSKGCIPFVGLYLSDLIFNAERPKFVKTKKDVSKVNASSHEDSCGLSMTQGDSTIGSTPGEEEKMINFSRFRTSVHIVKSLSQSIEWSQNYNVEVDEELLRKCLYIKSLDEGEMNFCLEQLET